MVQCRRRGAGSLQSMHRGPLKQALFTWVSCFAVVRFAPICSPCFDHAVWYCTCGHYCTSQYYCMGRHDCRSEDYPLDTIASLNAISGLNTIARLDSAARPEAAALLGIIACMFSVALVHSGHYPTSMSRVYVSRLFWIETLLQMCTLLHVWTLSAKLDTIARLHTVAISSTFMGTGLGGKTHQNCFANVLLKRPCGTCRSIEACSIEQNCF